MVTEVIFSTISDSTFLAMTDSTCLKQPKFEMFFKSCGVCNSKVYSKIVNNVVFLNLPTSVYKVFFYPF